MNKERIEEILKEAGLERMHRHVVKQSKPIENFKRENLSIIPPYNKSPLMKIGTVTGVEELAEYINSINHKALFPGKSSGFCRMSEVWLRGDFDRFREPVDNKEASEEVSNLTWPIIDQIRTHITNLIGSPAVIIRAYIDTLDDGSCIIPHSDGFLHHAVSFRVHVPVTTSPGSLGVTFNPWTCAPKFWRMNDAGGVYVMNNFEPHTVTKLDKGYRSHIICDVGLQKLTEDTEYPLAAKVVLMGYGTGTTLHYSPNMITHTTSNFDIRNRLGIMYSNMQPCKTLDEQVLNGYISDTITWTKRMFSHAYENNLIEVV
jgi:hypothetical protein